MAPPLRRNGKALQGAKHVRFNISRADSVDCRHHLRNSLFGGTSQHQLSRMTCAAVNRSLSAFSSDIEGAIRECEKSLPRSQTAPVGKPASWESMTYIETSRELSPLETGTLALEDQFCGWLWMRGSRLGRWRHRYFCLDGTMLSYFNSFPAEVFLKQAQASVQSSWTFQSMFHFGDITQPRGVVRVAHIDDSDTSNRIGFKVFGACGKAIDIRAHDAHERNRWLRALKTPARRKTRAWSIGTSEEVTMNMSSFDPDGLCRFDRQSIPVTKSGWIEKKSSFPGLWRRYFFVMQGSMLSYYASDKPYEVPRWRGYVESVKARRRSGSSVLPTAGGTMATPPLELFITLDSPQNQELHVRLATVEEARDWRRVLRANVRTKSNDPTSTA